MYICIYIYMYNIYIYIYIVYVCVCVCVYVYIKIIYTYSWPSLYCDDSRCAQDLLPRYNMFYRVLNLPEKFQICILETV